MLASAIFAPVGSRAASAYPQRESFKADPFEYARRGLEIGGRTSAGCAKYLAEGEERFERRNFSPSSRSFSPRTRFFRFYVSIEATSHRRSRFSKESPLVPEERCSSDEIFPQVAVRWAYLFTNTQQPEVTKRTEPRRAWSTSIYRRRVRRPLREKRLEAISRRYEWD